jgi:uncharacterized small protein (DUF1192 family)
MGLLHRLLGENKPNKTAGSTSPPELCRDDLLLLRVRDLQARVAEMRADVEDARALLRELSRRYS